MTGLVLQGPFLTRHQAADHLATTPREVVARPELLRIHGLLQECYFAFQCRADPVGRDVGRVVLAMKGRAGDLVIADWFIRSNPQLKETAPLTWLEQRWGLPPVLRAAEASDFDGADSSAASH